MKCPDCSLFFEGDFCPNCGKYVAQKKENYNLCTVCGTEYVGDICPSGCNMTSSQRAEQDGMPGAREIARASVRPVKTETINPIIPQAMVKMPPEAKKKTPIIIASLGLVVVTLVVVIVIMISNMGGGGAVIVNSDEISVHERAAGQSEYVIENVKRDYRMCST